MTRVVRDTDSEPGRPRITLSAAVHPYVWRLLGIAGKFTTMDTPDVGIPPQLARRMSMAEQYEYLRTKLLAAPRPGDRGRGGRRAADRLLRLGLRRGHGEPDGLAAVRHAAPTGTGRVDGSVVAPFGRHLAFGADPKTQMRISLAGAARGAGSRTCGWG